MVNETINSWWSLSDNFEYIFINLAIGTGISADAMIATVSRFKRFKSVQDALKWASAIGFTHTVFPMIGLIGLWYTASSFPALKAVIYGIGFMIMAWFIIEVTKEISGLNQDEEAQLEEEKDFFYQFLAKYSKFWAAVWAVSIDALITGPGKTAATAHWTQGQVLGSFPLVGFVVFTLVLLSAYPAILLRQYWKRNKFNNHEGMARFTTIGSWIELSIFLYFAYLAFLEMILVLGMKMPISEFMIAGILSMLTTVILLITLGKKVWRHQLEEAETLLQN